MKLLEIYKSLLIESANIHNIEDLYFTHVKKIWDTWKTKHPDEPGVQNPDYMLPEINRSSLQYNLSWIDMIQNMKSSTNVTRGNAECSKIKRACYYNSLVYIRKYDSEKISLAWGIAVELPELLNALDKSNDPNNTSNWISSFNRYCTVHAFLVTVNNKIIDPTWGLSGKGQTYFYELVPREIWKEFTFEENDKNFNAKDFADEYIAKVAGKKYSIKNIQNKWLDFIS